MKENLLDRARAAAATGEWVEAFDLLAGADADRELAVDQLGFLADVAYAAGHPDVTIATWERVYSAALQNADRMTAAGAATRVAMHLLFDAALLAPVRGWMKRADDLLGDGAETSVHAWLAVVKNYERMLSGDLQTALQWARRAVTIGARLDPGAGAIGRIAVARCLILEGDVVRGLELLNEAGVAAVSGELDPLSTGIVYCELVCALQGLAQYDLAEQWTHAMEAWRSGHPIGSIHGRCRVHRAEILRLRGSTTEAEEQARLACEELSPYLRRELGWPLTELGRILLRKGDLQGAEEAFRGALEAGWDPQPGLALLYLARGEANRAAASIRDALEHPVKIPSKELPPNTELRRAPLLEAQIEIAVAAGDLERARWATDELATIARQFGSGALDAGVEAARGRLHLAEGDGAAARLAFEAALHMWTEIGAPFEAARARAGLAEALLVEGSDDRARLEYETAGAVFERIGARLEADRVAHLLDRGAGAGDPLEKLAPQYRGPGGALSRRHAFDREGEYWCVTFDGETIRLRDIKGLRYLSRLLSAPGREMHVLDLVAHERGSTGVDRVNLAGDAGPLLDVRAKEAYRRRLAEIEDDLEEAQMLGDSERSAQAESERDVLMRELSRAVGLGGRDRRAGSASERARVSVTRAVRFALDRIRQHHPALGDHLERAIRTGTYCAYLPDPRLPMEWT